MSEDLAKRESTDLATVDVNRGDPPTEHQLVAWSRDQMQEAQSQLVEWAERKLVAAREELEEASDAKTKALAGGFDTGPFTRMIRRGTKRVQYWEKMREALAAGYVIMPDLPVEVFAVRTTKRLPKRKSSYSRFDHEQESEAPPAGEGEYRDSNPMLASGTEPAKDFKGEPIERFFYFPIEWQEAIDFPMVVAKPQIIERVNSAMSRKFFDEIGVLPSREAQKGDPVVVGIIKKPVPRHQLNSRVMFLIAWYVDTREI